jgi:hypothetical protein
MSRTRHSPCLVILMTLSCGSPAATVDTTDVIATADTPAADLAPLADIAPDLPPSDTSPDVADSAGTDATILSGTLGAPCDKNSDCDSGFCVPGPQGKVCSQVCTDNCPSGYACTAIGTGADLGYFCVPSFASLCNPCHKNADCSDPANGGGVCISHGSDGSFCGADCSKLPCPSGYACQSVIDQESGGSVKQCAPSGGVCSCNAAAIAAGLSTDCEVKNGVGTCLGERKCTTGGLTACSAKTPTAEVCNGQDDDCNGKTDDFTGTATCDKSNAFGSCKGILKACVDGVALCDAPTPAVETCNGQDDDCNGQTDDGLCDDGNPCTKDACGMGDFSCTHAPTTGNACNDQNDCTTSDACQNGVCVGGSVGCDDNNPCTADTCDQKGGCSHLAIDGSCVDDGSPCTLDICAGGACTHPNQLEGGPCPADGNPCTNEVCQKGVCDHVPVAFTVTCTDDGNECTADLCDNGNCTHQNFDAAKKCLPDSSPCTLDVCKDGACTHPAAVDNSLCADDGELCTADVCQSGVCKHPSLDNTACVDDGDPCTQDLCSGGGCTHPNKDGPACNDDGSACTNDLCQGGKCAHIYNDLGCDDGNPCTTVDYCNLGTCKGYTMLKCDDKNDCTNDACKAFFGCEYKPNQDVCDDGNVCTQNDICISGKCVGTGDKQCDDGVPCTVDSCDNQGGCKHTNSTAPCDDDGNACTNDLCASGTCAHPAVSVATNCGASTNPCTTGQCSGNTCVQTPNQNICDDGNACTSNDHCATGSCTGTAFKDCSDGNPCTQDSCDPFGTCTHAPKDGSSCVAGSGECPEGHCVAGSCLSTAGVTCQAEYDADLCTSVNVPGTCAASGKCVASSAPPGYSCPDCNGICLKCWIFQYCLAF